MFFVVGRVHDHSGRRYARGKVERIPSPSSFRWIYPYLRGSTATVAVASVWIEHVALLRIHASTVVAAVGWGAVALGLGLVVWARRTLGRHYSPCFDALVPQDVVRTGPYRYVRHPIYTANLLLVLGVFGLSGSALVLANAIVLAAYYRWSASREEEVLAQRFPAYRDYMATSGRFLPRVGRAARGAGQPAG